MEPIIDNTNKGAVSGVSMVIKLMIINVQILNNNMKKMKKQEKMTTRKFLMECATIVEEKGI